MRRTDVRPICSRRAISDLLTPARCSFRISAACTAAVAGRPSRFPFSRAWAKPSPSSFPQNLPFELGEDRQQSGHRSTGGRGQVQRLGQRHEAHAEMLQFLERRQQIRYRPAPAVQPPDQHHIDLPAAGGLQQFLTSFSLGRPGANLADLHGDRPAAPGGILPHGATLHRKRLLIVGGNAGVQAGAEHFRRFPCLAKNVIGFCLWRSPFCGHFGVSPNHGRSRSFSARQDSSYYAAAGWPAAPVFRGSSRASTPMGFASTPRRAAATRSDSRTDWLRSARRYGSDS